VSGGLPTRVGEEVVGRRTELRLLLAALARGKAVLLLGLPGVSKTTIVRALARHLAGGPDAFVDATGDEQLTAHALVGTFDPPMVLKDGYRPEHFVAGPLVRAMRAGGILYVEELNRAPSGALNALLTALSDGYVEVPRLGRVEAEPGFTVVGAANPLDDVGTARLSRGLADRFLVLELDYQPREEELEIAAAPATRGSGCTRSRSTWRASRARIPTCATARRSAARSTTPTSWPPTRPTSSTSPCCTASAAAHTPAACG
jgi:MoxR-like ATPase